MEDSRTVVEACVGDIESVIEAVAGGADRIELCDSLSEGGTTPSYGMIAEAVEITAPTNTKLHILVRPRAGNFCYTPKELKVIERDIEMARSLGVDGIVIGVLLPDSSVDFVTLEKLVKVAKKGGQASNIKISQTYRSITDITEKKRKHLNVSVSSSSNNHALQKHKTLIECKSKQKEEEEEEENDEAATATASAVSTGSPIACSPTLKVTFHRAFDVCVGDPLDVLSALHSHNIDYVLTSGRASSSWEGREVLRQLQNQAQILNSSKKPVTKNNQESASECGGDYRSNTNGSIRVVAGGGITSSTVGKLCTYTNITEYHAASALQEDIVGVVNTSSAEVSMGPASSGREHIIKRTSSRKVQELKYAIANPPPPGLPEE